MQDNLHKQNKSAIIETVQSEQVQAILKQNWLNEREALLQRLSWLEDALGIRPTKRKTNK